MIQTIGIYHIGIPVDDLDRAEGFYTKVLGMKVEARIGELGARLWCFFSVLARLVATR